MGKRRTFTVCGWLGDYWLGPAVELERLVAQEPEARYADRHRIRWTLVAHVGTEILRAARSRVADDCSPLLHAAWDVEVSVAPPERLTPDEERIVASLFTSEAAVADYASDQVTNGRHRMFYARSAGAKYLPIQSSTVSGWSDDLFGDPSRTTLEYQVSSCAILLKFAGRCATWRGDIQFVESLGDAVTVAEDFLDRVVEDAAKIDPGPRMLTRH